MKCLNAHLRNGFAHTCDLGGDFLVGVFTPPLRLPATGAAAPLARKLRVNYGLGFSGAWICNSLSLTRGPLFTDIDTVVLTITWECVRYGDAMIPLTPWYC